jgi:1-acyl-sn-glycerol-3-phosphate acyltransferase
MYHSGYRGSSLATTLFDAFVRLYLRPKVSGRLHLPKRSPFILAANHASHADTAAIYAALPRRLRTHTVAAAAQDYFFENSIRRASARVLFNAVPVDRRPVAGRDPLRHAIRALREGYGVLIYPEGTRSPDGSIGAFRGGIGRLIALYPDAPVIPIWLDTAQVMPKGAVAPQPRAIEVRFGPPLRLAAQADDRASWQAAADAVREAVVALHEQDGADNQVKQRWFQRLPRLSLPIRAWRGRQAKDKPRAETSDEPTAISAPHPSTRTLGRWQMLGARLKRLRRRRDADAVD